MTDWHIHYTGESQDVDGRTSYGHDYAGRENVEPRLLPHDGPEDDLDLITRALAYIWRLPQDGPVQIQIDHDPEGRLTVAGGGQTEEGWWSESYVICDLADFDPAFRGYRDHTAENAGY